MQIFIGPSGIPISARAKGLNTLEGLMYVHELGLNAMELDFVQQVYLNNEQAEILGRVARKLGVRLSIHAQYYINLCSEKREIIEASMRRILTCAERGERMKADAIAIHAAFYGKLDKNRAYEMVRDAFSKILDQLPGSSVKLGIETMAKKSQFGTLDEVIRLYNDLDKQVIPYIDFAHLFARNDGKIDYGYVLDRLEQECDLKHINAHFEGLQNKNGKFIDVHAPIGSPPFEPLAAELLGRKGSISIICESPLLEIDCLKMRSILENIGYKF